MNRIVYIILVLGIGIFAYNTLSAKKSHKFDIISEKRNINLMLDSFNVAAAKADYSTYFNFYCDDAIFTGTDAKERWNKKEFMVWAKPFFDRGKAWNFKSLQRHIYFDKTGNLAWFDELLNTQMKICRGSGVLVKQGKSWKIEQYILSATIPNPIMDEVVKMKAGAEDSLMNVLRK
ncbi:nuclear transport factor 2 family protein [Pedobacter sp. SD-b]|uniref:Nuclear transport factor 2 family protein n=1 Tax=Pedobacter segetis TaxID=2793069 RepID=A0ABS1BM38_9SPHI|nr:nuclear transport factor 2 family protein [Pedobacter segetis]MBK0383960.1 nuclear transport factor 2 family protein [Pedobacter segetis]